MQGTLRRIGALGVPAVWTEVWICRDASGPIQATGRDARSRKQCRYHDDWREVRDQNKFERIVEFARLLPAICARVQRDMGKRGAPRATNLRRAFEVVAARLRNTTTICRKCYVHPEIVAC